MIEKIERFDKPTLKILRNELEETLKQLSKHGLKIDVGSMRYSNHEVDVKLNILIEGQKTRSQESLVHIANMLDLDLTKIVNSNGKAYSLVDYRPKASVWEFIVQDNKTGKQVLMTRNTIKEMFKKECA
tara:strand:+ start:727 stop:1113 length:387 start_codon:yes stop_codon:yes gene_type:complete